MHFAFTFLARMQKRVWTLDVKRSPLLFNWTISQINWNKTKQKQSETCFFPLKHNWPQAWPWIWCIIIIFALRCFSKNQLIKEPFKKCILANFRPLPSLYVIPLVTWRISYFTFQKAKYNIRRLIESLWASIKVITITKWFN